MQLLNMAKNTDNRYYTNINLINQGVTRIGGVFPPDGIGRPSSMGLFVLFLHTVEPKPVPNLTSALHVLISPSFLSSFS